MAVGGLHADETFARDGGLDADGVGGEGEGEILLEGGDGLYAHAEAGFDAELGDARADDGIVDEGIDGEAIERGLENGFVGGDLFGRDELTLGGGDGAECVEGGELVAGDVFGGEGSRERGAGSLGRVIGSFGVGGGLPDGGDVGLAVAGVLAEGSEVIEGVFEAVAVAGLESGAFLAASGESFMPDGEQGMIFGEGGVVGPDGSARIR